jgi:CubicO group peptidase (beta-lactamase class C family)
MTAVNKNMLNRIEELIKAAVEEQNIAGANVLVYQNGVEQYYCEGGLADRENNVPIRRDTIFRLYSMTKPVTGAAMMLLMQRGIVDLCDPVSKYIPGFKNQKVHTADGLVPVERDVTIKDLLGMVSGLPYGHPETEAGREVEAVFSELESSLATNSPITTMELANRIGGCGLLFQPGEWFRYGTSADVAGAVIEAVTGKRLGEFLREEIFEPLHMHDTGFYVPENKRNRLAKTYEETPNGMVEYMGDRLGIVNRMPQPPAFESGGAGLSSTIDDYGKFAAMLLNGGTANGRQFLTPRAMALFTTPQLAEAQLAPFWQRWDGLSGFNYGNFMRIMERPGQAKMMASMGEYGWDGALGVYFANSPADRLTFLFMTQRLNSGTMPLTRKCRNIVFSAME